MDRFAIFVDAGYFFAAGAYAVASANIPRRNISLIAAEATIKNLCEFGAKQSSTPTLLRVYWYDAMMGPRPSMEQSALAHLAGVKLRLGSLNNAGEQKGVDSLIVTDLIELARNRAISDAILISGDEDLRIAVQLAQTFGVRVHILAVGDAAKNVSPSLKMEADSLEMLDIAWLKAHLSIAGSSPPSTTNAMGQPPQAATSNSLEEAARTVCNELLDAAGTEALANLAAHFKTSTSVPPEFDRKLIAKTAKEINRKLTSDEMRKIRGVFVTNLRGRTTSE
jgi:uncharacterized LabA/DUF88 family protein